MTISSFQNTASQAVSTKNRDIAALAEVLAKAYSIRGLHAQPNMTFMAALQEHLGGRVNVVHRENNYEFRYLAIISFDNSPIAILRGASEDVATAHLINSNGLKQLLEAASEVQAQLANAALDEAPEDIEAHFDCKLYPQWTHGEALVRLAPMSSMFQMHSFLAYGHDFENVPVYVAHEGRAMRVTKFLGGVRRYEVETATGLRVKTHYSQLLMLQGWTRQMGEAMPTIEAQQAQAQTLIERDATWQISTTKAIPEVGVEVLVRQTRPGLFSVREYRALIPDTRATGRLDAYVAGLNAGDFASDEVQKQLGVIWVMDISGEVSESPSEQVHEDFET